jgi:Na+:H+ antiporter, NhaA family
VLSPFARFINLESGSSVALLLATAIALLMANSRFEVFYNAALQFPIGLDAGPVAFRLSVRMWVNEILMSFFFLAMGLEIKRELFDGELASVRRAMLPVVAAIGGMLFPALLYLALNFSGPYAKGWGIPIATDIAFSLAVLRLFGARIPIGLKVFLVSLAIADDIGGVVVIATAYVRELHLKMLIVAAALSVVCLLMNRLRITWVSMYLSVGAVIWWALKGAGIHPTLAGIVVAFAIPSRHRLTPEAVGADGKDSLRQLEKVVLYSDSQRHELREFLGRVRDRFEMAESPLDRLQYRLQPWISFAVMPIFALANAGVPLRGFRTEDILRPSFLGILLGLLIGKPMGITLFSWLAVRYRLAVLPQRVSWKQLHAVSWLGGIGFTISIFIAGLAFEAGELYTIACVAVFSASLCAAFVGAILIVNNYRNVLRESMHLVRQESPTNSGA